MPDAERPFRIGKRNGLLWFIGLLGICSSVHTLSLSFIPPSQITTGSDVVWFSVLIGGALLVIIAPFVIYALRKPSWKNNGEEDSFQPFHWEKTNDNEVR